MAEVRLPPRQARAWALQVEGKKLAEIAVEMGISVSVVKQHLTTVRLKMGLSTESKKDLEYRAPEVAAAALDAAADGLSRTQVEAIRRVNEQLEASGVPGRVSKAMVRRMLVRYADVVTVKRAIDTKWIEGMLDEKIHLIGSYVDDKLVAEASLRDAGLVMTAFIEKRQLLRGEPTQIINDVQRKKLNELLPLAIAEVMRRGLTLQGVIVEKIVEPAT